MDFQCGLVLNDGVTQVAQGGARVRAGIDAAQQAIASQEVEQAQVLGAPVMRVIDRPSAPEIPGFVHDRGERAPDRLHEGGRRRRM